MRSKNVVAGVGLRRRHWAIVASSSWETTSGWPSIGDWCYRYISREGKIHSPDARSCPADTLRRRQRGDAASSKASMRPRVMYQNEEYRAWHPNAGHVSIDDVIS